MRLRMTKDLLSGLLFVGIGGFALIVAQGYRLGTPNQMGPGFFPTMLAAIIVLLGCIMVGRAIATPDSSEVVAQWEPWPLLTILASIIAFALLIRSAGLVVAIAATVAISRLARRDGNVFEVAALIVVLCVVTILIFTYGLRLPLKVWPV